MCFLYTSEKINLVYSHRSLLLHSITNKCQILRFSDEVGDETNVWWVTKWRGA